MEKNEKESYRVLFLGVGIALSHSENLSPVTFFEFIKSVNLSEELFYDFFPSFEVFIGEVNKLKRRANIES